MKRLNLKQLLALSAALGITCAGSAQAQWVITGPSPLGGNAFTGYGNVGALSTSTSPALSLNGGDTITLSIGSIASNSTPGVDTIIISGPNNILTNNGAIVSDNFADYAIDLFASNQVIINNGAIIGGNGAPGGNNGGQAIYAFASALDMLSFTNHGVITGGNGSDGTGSGGGNGNAGIYLYTTSADLTNTSIVNTGRISGGLGGSDSSTYGGSGGSAVYAYASGNLLNFTVNNSGLILGGNGGNSNDTTTSYGSYAGYGLYFGAGGLLANFSLTNSGIIQGGNGGADSNTQAYGGQGGYGMYVYGSSINNLLVNNSGQILGGNGGSTPDLTGQGYSTGAPALYLATGGLFNGLTLENTGLVAGGNGGSGGYYGNPGGEGIYIYTYGLANMLIANQGTIRGGAGGNSGYVNGYGYYGGADAIYIYSDTYSQNLSNITLKNSGLILGGNGGDGPAFYNTIGGYGVDLYNYSSINNLLIDNSGTIAGGNGGVSNLTGGGGSYLGEDTAGYGISLSTSFDINGMTLNNSGLIQGGNGGITSGSYSMPGGYGAYIFAGSAINGFFLNNSGSILGGNGGASFNTGGNDDGDGHGGDGLLVESSVISNAVLTNSGRIIGGNGGYSLFESGQGGVGLVVGATTLTNVTINNSATGLIQGGDGGEFDGSFYSGQGASGGQGLYLYGPNSSNVVVNNWGVIRGGNGGAGINGGIVGDAGIGLLLVSNGVTVNNWGTISAGMVGTNPAAVLFDGKNNTLNLEGHSSVFGLIAGPSGANNVVNLKFTGVSPLEQQQLISQITSQGSLSNFSGSFTLRGVTYNIDPVVLNISLSSYQQQVITPAEAAVGASLDSLTFNPAPGTPLANLLNAIDTSGNVSLALNALSPQSYQIFGDIAESTANMLTLSIDERLNNLRDGSESIDTTGIGGNTDKTTAGYSKDGKTVQVPEKAAVDRRWGFFAQGGGLFSTIDAHQGLAGSNFTTSSVVVGVDGKVNDNFVVGALFNYDYTTADIDNVGSHANVQTLGGGLYAGYHNGGWYGNALAAYGHNQYDSQRVIAFPGFNSTANGGTDGNQYEGNLDGGYDFNVSDRLSVGPLIGLQYVHLDVNNLNEWGSAGAGLNVGSQSVDSLRSRIGFHAQYKLQVANEVAFATEVHAAWQHEFLDDSRAISASFIGGSVPFSVQTTSPERDAAVVGIGADLTVRNRMTLFINYDVQAGQQSYFEQTVKGGVKFAF